MEGNEGSKGVFVQDVKRDLGAAKTGRIEVQYCDIPALGAAIV